MKADASVVSQKPTGGPFLHRPVQPLCSKPPLLAVYEQVSPRHVSSAGGHSNRIYDSGFLGNGCGFIKRNSCDRSEDPSSWTNSFDAHLDKIFPRERWQVIDPDLMLLEVVVVVEKV
jgi:hypothetical protein